MSEREEVVVEAAGGAVLAGTLTVPARSARSTAIVAVHGASEGTRDAPLLRHIQSLLPRHGVATLIFDRRGEGASTGAPRQASFEDVATDVSAWVGYLRRHPQIDAAKVGLWSFSQGGFIAPLVVADDSDLAFLVAVSPSGVPPAEQMAYAAATLLGEAGYPESATARMRALRERVDAYFRGRLSFDEVWVLVDEARAEPWFELAYVPSLTSPTWRLQLDFDVRPYLRRLRLPVLLIFGERDRWVPIEASVEAWRSSLGSGVDLTLAHIPGAGHSPTLATDPGDLRERGPISPNYERVLLSWLLRLSLGTTEG